MRCSQVNSISSLSTLVLRALRDKKKNCCPLTLPHICYRAYIYIICILYIYIYYMCNSLQDFEKPLGKKKSRKKENTKFLEGVIFF